MVDEVEQHRAVDLERLEIGLLSSQKHSYTYFIITSGKARLEDDHIQWVQLHRFERAFQSILQNRIAKLNRPS